MLFLQIKICTNDLAWEKRIVRPRAVLAGYTADANPRDSSKLKPSTALPSLPPRFSSGGACDASIARALAYVCDMIRPVGRSDHALTPAICDACGYCKSEPRRRSRAERPICPAKGGSSSHKPEDQDQVGSHATMSRFSR